MRPPGMRDIFCRHPLLAVDEAGVEKAAERVGTGGGKGDARESGTASYFCADVGKGDELREVIRFAVETYGQLDILTNNAYSGHNASVLDLEERDCDAVFAVTVRAAFLGGKYAIPEMTRAGGGSIIIVSPVYGLLGGRASAPYDAAKAATINLTRQTAVDHGQYGIRVNELCPGRIVTEKKVNMLQEHPEQVRRQKLTYPLGRPGTMREAAHAALCLASDESSFATGHALVVDGGLTAPLQDAPAAFVERGLAAGLSLDRE